MIRLTNGGFNDRLRLKIEYTGVKLFIAGSGSCGKIAGLVHL